MCCTAYWIAFGAHGPRAVTPPGEGWKVLGYTLAGVAVSFALFASVRAFARGPPATMTKEYQEASNEYLLVCFPLSSLKHHLLRRPSLTSHPLTGPKLRPHQRSLLRGLQGPRNGPVPTGRQEVKHVSARLRQIIDSCTVQPQTPFSAHGRYSVCRFFHLFPRFFFC